MVTSSLRCNAALPKLISQLIPITCTKALLNFSILLIIKFTSQHFTFFTSWGFALSQMYLYQKDKWALPGILKNRENMRPSPFYVLSLSLLLPPFSHLCMSRFFFGGGQSALK
jgi:hypothetical protein